MREIRAGLATFLTMAYILFVNPSILAKAITVPNASAQLLTSTALAAAIGTFLMAGLARYPFALAPGMGLNAFFTFGVVQAMGVTWQTALAAVLVSGIIVVIISATGVREVVVNAIPPSIKDATAAGIGLFLALLGFQNAGISVDHPVTLMTLGPMAAWGPVLCMGGVLLGAVLMARRITGALLIVMAVVSAVAALVGASVFGGQTFAGFPNGFIAAPVWPTDLFFQYDFSGLFTWQMLSVILMFCFVDFFDTAGTLFGLAGLAGYLNKRGELPRARQAFVADALATCFASMIGNSPTTTYVESAAGIQEGGRTWVTSATVGVLFLASIFFWPFATAVATPATAAVLILVGCLMVSCINRIQWNDYEHAIPAFLTVIGIPMTFSIANGVAFGIMAYAAISIGLGRFKQHHWLLYGLSLVLLFRYLCAPGA